MSDETKHFPLGADGLIPPEPKRFDHEAHCNVRYQPMGCDGCSCTIGQMINRARASK